jgi:hypothetical protein
VWHENIVFEITGISGLFTTDHHISLVDAGDLREREEVFWSSYT